MNNSIESPRRTAAIQTPMAHSMQVDSLQTSPRNAMRHAGTPQGKGVSQQKFKKGPKRVNNMKDMVFIYADMG